jgi:hypothetical protein
MRRAYACAIRTTHDAEDVFNPLLKERKSGPFSKQLFASKRLGNRREVLLVQT